MSPTSKKADSLSAAIFREEAVARELLASASKETIGARLAYIRMEQGLSIRDLAARAGVNKNSVLKVERGGPAQPITIVKICAALGMHVAAVLKQDRPADVAVAVHKRLDDRWYDLVDFGGQPLSDAELDEKERKALAEEGIPVLMLLLKSRLQHGFMQPSLLEIYGPSEPRSHVGEELLYVTTGALSVAVGATTFVLGEGECMTFLSSEQHAYAPAEGAELPVRALSVVVHRRPSS